MNESGRQSELSVGVVLSSVSRNAGGVFDAVRQACAAIMSDPAIAVEVHGVEDNRTADDISDWAPVPVTVYRRSGPAAFARAPELHAAICKSDRLDVLHQHGIWQSPSQTTRAWRKRTGKPVIISPHGMLDPWAVQNSKWKKQIAATLFERDNLEGATCLHALNIAELEAIRTYGLSNPVAIIANGVSLPPENDQIRSKTDDAGRKTLLFLGRVHPKKGLSELLVAWSKLKDHAPEIAARWKIKAAGWDDGGHLDELITEAEMLGLSDDVNFPGPLFGSDKAQAFQEASAFILASHSEGLPMAILEAWAWRLPVFMTAACNLPVGFEKQAAFEITTDPGKLAQTLASQLGREDIQEMGENGFELASNQFTWAAIGGQFRELYRWVASGADPAEKPEFVYL